MIEHKYLAAVALQRAASPLILVTTTDGMMETFRNTLALRSFQISVKGFRLGEDVPSFLVDFPFLFIFPPTKKSVLTAHNLHERPLAV
jgi:hypothetical protein